MFEGIHDKGFDGEYKKAVDDFRPSKPAKMKKQFES